MVINLIHYFIILYLDIYIFIFYVENCVVKKYLVTEK